MVSTVYQTVTFVSFYKIIIPQDILAQLEPKSVPQKIPETLDNQGNILIVEVQFALNVLLEHIDQVGDIIIISFRH